MKRKKLLPIFVLTIFCNINLMAQSTFEVPSYTKPISKEDSAKLETAVVDAAKWVETTDLNKFPEKRKEVNSFLLMWYIDNITLNISLVNKLSKINEGNSDLLLIYFAGFSKYYIENKIIFTKFSATKAGLVSVMNVYKKGIGITKSQELERLIKLTEENKLDEYVKENFD